MESADTHTLVAATPIDNADKLKKTPSPNNVYKTNSLQHVDSTDFPELPEPFWSKYLPNPYSEKRVLNLTPFQMKWAVQLVAGIAILFFGFDQGVMSGVNESKDYLRLMGTASGVDGNETERDSAAIGGIVAIYYLGTLLGGFLGGYMADNAGRMKTILFGSFWVVLGASLQVSAQNITWMMIARVLCGIGTGIYNAVVPVWVAELSRHDKRGQAIGFEFTANIAGLALVYWISFAVRDMETGGFNWRFPLAFQLIFIIMLVACLPFFPESPRWLAKMGRVDEARRILSRLREQDVEVERELQEILAVARVERVRQGNGEDGFLHMLWTSDGKLHIRRRIILVVWLQILQELAGIGVITVYAPTVFRSGGFSDTLARLLSGFNDVSYMFSVLIAVFLLDRTGRRKTLYWGNIVMGICLFIAGVAAKYSLQYGAESATPDLALAKRWGAALAAMVFLYTATFGATWLSVPWLYPTEVFPLFIRAKGGSWSVFGWSIGNGIVTEITPFLFNAISYNTFFLFGALNFFCLPFVWAFYPETSCRSLESIDELFESDSAFIAFDKRLTQVRRESLDETHKA
ncbi:General substrate transporter [Kalmanozyma brasiliensis GHG001]|uniref:Sugar transporter n=1 Tax=Kalmanozyma brasiliensis (strain GHG001) TaxID=1365824 RepID=V5GS88_KALBG|nr:General substrate transporter [Kalmanozyma brasiliensis GHG001]EST08802.1 General substrate transporter [Kalmanozyma brasiliensis GHG001]